MSGPKSVREHKHRNDLTGEHPWGDAGQIVFALLFFGVWIADSFILHYTMQLNGLVPIMVRVPVGLVFLTLSAYCAGSGLAIVFDEVRETPSVIRKGAFRFARHPVYLSEVLCYFGLFIVSMSIAAGIIWLAATGFLYYLSRYEEKLLLARFGEDYKSYIREVGIWFPRLGRK